MKHIKVFEQFVNEAKISLVDFYEDNIDNHRSAKSFIKAAVKAGFKESDVEDLLDNVEQGGDSYAKLSKDIFNESINEASYGQNYLWEIATPAPASMLARDLEKMFGKGRIILGDWNSPEGFESVVMLNLQPKEVKEIEENIGDVLIFRMEITNRSEW